MDKSLYVLGGAAWINLVNTTYISNKEMIDILSDRSKTLQWLKANNLLRESDESYLKNNGLLNFLIDELHLLRQLCKMTLLDIEQQGKLSLNTTERLKMLVQQIQVNLTLISMDEKLNLVPEGMTTIDHVKYNILYSLIHTLNSTSIERIRQCEHQECILYFVDTSKSGKRRWCSMGLCGNRQKASEFYARKKVRSNKQS